MYSELLRKLPLNGVNVIDVSDIKSWRNDTAPTKFCTTFAASRKGCAGMKPVVIDWTDGTAAPVQFNDLKMKISSKHTSKCWKFIMKLNSELASVATAKINKLKLPIRPSISISRQTTTPVSTGATPSYTPMRQHTSSSVGKRNHEMQLSFSTHC
jgi:hypothetical protein